MKNIPEWLVTEEQYDPPADKDAFISKSVSSILLVLTKVRLQPVEDTASHFYIQPAVKLFFTVLLIALLSLARSFSFLGAVYVYLFVMLSFMKASQIVAVLKSSLLFACFAFLVLLPSVFWSRLSYCLFLAGKTLATAIAVNLLSHSTKWNSITGALKFFFLPDVFIFVLDLSIKYVVQLGSFLLDMLYALKLRSVGKNKKKFTSISGLMGTMFIKSKETAEDIYHAMECRGYTGEYHTSRKFSITGPDLAYSAVNGLIIALFITN